MWRSHPIQEALAVARSAGDMWADAYVLGHEALLEAEGGDHVRCHELAGAARDVALRSAPSLAWQTLALAMRLIGYKALQAGRLDESDRWFEEATALLRKHGDVWSIGILLVDLAGLCVLQGRHDEACVAAKEALFGSAEPSRSARCCRPSRC